VAIQRELAPRSPPPWHRPDRRLLVAGCFVCFARGVRGPGAQGDPAWGGGALLSGRRLIATVAVEGAAGAPYEPGLLALREGPLLEAALRALPEDPDVVMVDASARDHPRGAGLALHLGAILDVPSIGVTDRPLVAEAIPMPDRRGETSPLRLRGREVGRRLRTRPGARAVCVHPGWRMEAETAVQIVLATTRRARTPEPLRRARRAARQARAAHRIDRE
jgi:deoxyribonuclease V